MAAEDGVRGASEAFHDQLPLGAMLCDLGLWLGTEGEGKGEGAGAGAAAGAAAGAGAGMRVGAGAGASAGQAGGGGEGRDEGEGEGDRQGDTLPSASTGEGRAECTIDITDGSAGGCAAAAVGGARVAAVWYPELRLKVSVIGL